MGDGAPASGGREEVRVAGGGTGPSVRLDAPAAGAAGDRPKRMSPAGQRRGERRGSRSDQVCVGRPVGKVVGSVG